MNSGVAKAANVPSVVSLAYPWNEGCICCRIWRSLWIGPAFVALGWCNCYTVYFNKSLKGCIEGRGLRRMQPLNWDTTLVDMNQWSRLECRTIGLKYYLSFLCVLYFSLLTPPVSVSFILSNLWMRSKCHPIDESVQAWTEINANHQPTFLALPLCLTPSLSPFFTTWRFTPPFG